MANQTFRSTRPLWACILILGLFGFFWQAGCRMQSREIRKETGKLEKIKAAGRIVVGTSADYPPYEFHLLPELESEMVGIDIDIAEAIAADLNVKLEIKDIVFSKLFDELAAGHIDMALAGLSPTENRKLIADFSIPYYQAIQNMLIRAGDKDKIRLLDDLRGKVVGDAEGLHPGGHGPQPGHRRHLLPGRGHRRADRRPAPGKGGRGHPGEAGGRHLFRQEQGPAEPGMRYRPPAPGLGRRLQERRRRPAGTGEPDPAQADRGKQITESIQAAKVFADKI